MVKEYKRILIANRGEIAVRIIRACRELGIETVSVHSKIDAGALHTRISDYQICIGNFSSRESYLNSYNILSAAKNMKVDAIHPGIGYFAENGDFAELCEKCEIDYIGAGSRIVNLMGNKIEAKRIAQQCGIPVIGSDSVEVKSAEDCYEYIEKSGLPVILKAANGGGGKGIRVVRTLDELKRNLELCRKEAKTTFGNSSILIEKYIENVKHVEIQVIGDKYGNVIHLGERECSIQRSNQKLIEEAQCIYNKEEIRNKMYEDSLKLCRYIGYVGPGTVEYLLESDGTYYFMEMNTRLQVEHTITEMLTGVDIVKEQILIAQGNPLQYTQSDISFNGYTLECRILAEYVKEEFIPSFGKITKWHLPGGFGVRVDTGYEIYDEVTPFYDSLLAKICCFGATKEAALTKMICCLQEIDIEGISTNVPFLLRILRDDKFLSGDYNTDFIRKLIDEKNVLETVQKS